ncbi:MAG: TolC family protein [Proteobacteria bacterium]|nr:TolC family protein [Pseudomonadota bacterium]
MVFKLILLLVLMASTTCADELSLEQAIESTLQLQADIIYSKLSAEASRKASEGARGPFDHILSTNVEFSSAQTPLDEIEQQLYNRDLIKTEPQTYGLTLTKLTRSGIGIETTASVISSNDISPALTQPREASSSISVAINFPIFDLIMENTNTTNEKIAIESNKAIINNYFFQASTSVYQTALNYWAYLAAYERLLIYKDNEKNTRKMLSDFEKLVANGERPKADANQIKANLAVKLGQVVSGEKDLMTMGCELAKSMGMPYDGTNLPRPKSLWAHVQDPDTLEVDDFVQRAFEHRYDIKSLESVIRSTELMLESSKRIMKPDLNFYVKANYSDKGPHVSEDVIDNAKTYTAGVVFSTPLGNSSAKSDLAQKEIALRQRALNLANAKRKASYDVASSINELTQNLKAYAFSIETVTLYKESLDVEEKKLKLGMSTVLDVINTRENYQNALVAKIENMRQVAVALAGVLYDAGDIISIEGDRISANLSALYSLSTN